MFSRTLIAVAVLLLAFAALPAAAAVQPDLSLDKVAVTRALDAFYAGETLTPAQVRLLEAAGFDFSMPGSGELDDSGGPDLFGHLWDDSNEPDGPVYDWIDITGIGTNIAPELFDDDTNGPHDLGFTFPFYENAFNQVYVQSNGALTFGDYYVTYSNTELPFDIWDATNDDSMIAWYWDDFDVNQGAAGDIYVAQTTVDDRQAWICSYIDVSHFPNGETELFTGQVILFEDGEIKIQIQGATPTWLWDSCTIGIQNSDLSDWLQVVYNMPYAEPELAIRFTLADPDASLSGQVTEAGSGAPVEGAEVHVGSWTTETNTNGMYSVESLYGGVNYDILVVGPQHYHYTDNILVQTGTNTLDMEIVPYPEPYPGSYEENFEGGPGIFQPTGDWQHGTPTWWPAGAWSGTGALSTILDGPYNNGRDDWLNFNETFFVNSEEASVSYMHWFNYQATGDGYNLQISTDGMETWAPLQPVGGYNNPNGVASNGYQPCFSNWGTGSGVWSEVTYDLSPYFEQQIWLAFRHSTDDTINPYSGVTIDDLTVDVGGAATAVNLDLVGVEVVVPPSGGTVVYDAFVHSTLPSPVTGQAWTMVTLPNGSQLGPLVVVPVMITPGTTSFVGLALNVPAAAPGGEYLYSGFLGQYPGFVADQDAFAFTKIGTAASAGGGSWSAEDWQAAEIVGEDETAMTLPTEWALSEAHPNPFNPATTLTVSLPEAAELAVTVYNVAGQQVAELARGRYPAGRHALTFDASHLASGMYFVRAEAPGRMNVMRKVMLVR